MVKIVARNRAGGFQRLVVMTEKEYEELRAASLLLQSKKTGPTNSLVDKYLDDNAHPEISMSERLALFNQAVAREDAGRQFNEGRHATFTMKPQDMDVPTTKAQLAVVPATTTTTTNTTTTATQEEVEEKPTSSLDADFKNDGAAGTVEQDKPDTTLPEVRVPVVHASRLAAITKILQASGTVSVDKLGLVYLDRALLDAKSNYFDLMRSLFVQAKQDAYLPGRARFLEHLHKLGVSAKHVTARSAKQQLEKLASQSKQEGSGGKTQRKTPEKRAQSSRPPGKRPKVLLVYR